MVLANPSYLYTVFGNPSSGISLNLELCTLCNCTLCNTVLTLYSLQLYSLQQKKVPTAEGCSARKNKLIPMLPLPPTLQGKTS